MHLLALLGVATLALLAMPAPIDIRHSVIVHTDDTNLMSRLGARHVLGFANSSNIKSLKSFDGTGVKLGAVNFHDTYGGGVTRDTRRSTSTFAPPDGKRDNGIVPTCGAPTCYTNDASYSNLEGLAAMTKETCAWVFGQMEVGDTWSNQGEGWTVWINNVMCDGNIECAVAVSIGILIAPVDSDHAFALMNVCSDAFLTGGETCSSEDMGSETYCSDPDVTGVFHFKWRAFPGDSWGGPCTNDNTWAVELKCGYMDCGTDPDPNDGCLLRDGPPPPNHHI